MMINSFPEPYVIDTSNKLCTSCEKGTYYDSESCLSTSLLILQ